MKGYHYLLLYFAKPTIFSRVLAFPYIAIPYFFDVTIPERSATVRIITGLGENERTFVAFETSLNVVDAHFQLDVGFQEKIG